MKQIRCIRDCWWRTRHYPSDPPFMVEDDVKVPRHFEEMPEKQIKPEDIEELSEDVEFEEPTEIEEAEKAEKSKKEKASEKK